LMPAVPAGANFSASIGQPTGVGIASVESLVSPLVSAEISQAGGGMGQGGLPGAMAGGMGGGGFGGVGGGGVPQRSRLPRLIPITIAPDSWSEMGGSGSIVQYGDGLLVAKNTQKVHEKIRQLLTMLRESNREQGPGGVGGGGGVFAPSTSSLGGPPSGPPPG